MKKQRQPGRKYTATPTKLCIKKKAMKGEKGGKKERKKVCTTRIPSLLTYRFRARHTLGPAAHVSIYGRVVPSCLPPCIAESHYTNEMIKKGGKKEKSIKRKEKRKETREKRKEKKRKEKREKRKSKKKNKKKKR